MAIARSRRGAAAAAVLAISAALVASAGAADKPVPCVGEWEDPAGDAYVGFSGNSSPARADDNQDIKSLFFRNDGRRVTANLRIADLTKDVSGQGNVYRLFWTYKETDYFIDVEVSATGDVTYTYGHFDPTPVGDGDTSGQFIEGKDGIIAVTIPTAAGGRPGTTLDAIRMNASTSTGVILLQSDVVPDADGVKYRGDQCPGTGATGSTGPTGQVRAVSLKATGIDKAKKASKRKALGLRLRASETLSAVTVTLEKGAKALGSAKRASLGTTPAKVTIKLKRKLKKGSYTLAATGKKTDGTKASATVKIAVK